MGASEDNYVEDLAPGTIQLVDLAGTIHGQHASGALADIVLVPTPSADPEDPLNWSPNRKLISTIAISTYTFTVGFASAAIYSVLFPISADTGLTLADLNAGTGYMFLAFGWGCVIWQPLALQYGKRPAFLASLIGTMCIMIWVPHATTNGQWIGSKILQGFFGAPIESLVEIFIADVHFAHNRGFYLGLYALMLAGSSFFAPIVSGFISDNMGWPWVLYWCAIFCAIGFVVCFFFLEETNYDRPSSKETSTSSSVQDKNTPISPHSDVKESQSTPQPSDLEQGTGSSYSTKTYLQKLSIVDKPRPFRVFHHMARPFHFFTFPVVVFAGFSYGSALIWFNVLNGTAGLVLTSPPYNFAASIVGAAYTSPLLGVALGSFYSGYLGDRITIWLARRNKGIREPEQRLWLFGVSVILVPVSLILWGVGASKGVHWFGILFAMFLLSVHVTIGLQLSISYCIDSYKDAAQDAIVTVILIRNTMSFAVGYGITPWVEMGLQNAFIIAALVGLAQILTVLIPIKWGKGWRRASKEKYARYLKENEVMGIAH